MKFAFKDSCKGLTIHRFKRMFHIFITKIGLMGVSSGYWINQFPINEFPLHIYTDLYTDILRKKEKLFKKF